MRGEVNKVIEQACRYESRRSRWKRQSRCMLDADLAVKLNALGDELRFVLLTSGAKRRRLCERADAQQRTAQRAESRNRVKLKVRNARAGITPSISARWRNTRKSADAV